MSRSRTDLLVVPAGRARLPPPLPVERLWGVGPVTSTKLRSRGYRTVGDVAELGRGALVAMLGPGAGEPPARARAQLRPEARADGSPARLDRLPVRPRPRSSRTPEEVDAILLSLVDRVTAGCDGRDESAAPSCSPPLRRLHPRDALPHLRPPDRAHAHDRRHGAGLLATAWPMIRRRGLTLVGVAVANLDSGDAVQLLLPFDGTPAGRSTRRSTRSASASAPTR